MYTPSELELSNIKAMIDSVEVYGKIPKSSIAIPTYTGESYSPDFMYVIRRKDGMQELHLVVETKDVDTIEGIRNIEKEKIKCARKFFDEMTKEGYTVHFHVQTRTKNLLQIVESIAKAP